MSCPEFCIILYLFFQSNSVRHHKSLWGAYNLQYVIMLKIGRDMQDTHLSASFPMFYFLRSLQTQTVYGVRIYIAVDTDTKAYVKKSYFKIKEL